MSEVTTQLDAPEVPTQRSDLPVGRAIRKFRPDIEGLRAIAVTLVVLSHLGLSFPGGFVGVDVFFVISGFLITRQLFGELSRTGSVSLKRFYARRVRRILPAATIVIVGTILAVWRWDSPLQVKPEALNGLFAAFSGLNWRLATQGTNYFALGSAPSPFQHFWSLAVEEQFYIVWPALLLIVGGVLGRRFGRRKSMVWTLLVIMAASLALSITTTASSPSWAYFGTQTRAWELALGALLAVTVDVWTRMPPALASQMSWMGLGLIGLSAFIYGGSTAYPGVAVVLPVLGSAFVIAGGCPGWPRGGELILKRRPMQFLGKTSYSWYLVHWPVLIIVPLALGHGLTAAGKWAVLFGSLAIAVAMYYVIEQPVRLRPLLVNNPRYSLALGCTLILVSIGTAQITFDNVVIPGTGGPAGRQIAAARNLTIVEKAVTAGAKLTRLPSNIDPPLTKAPTDRPFTTRSCLVSDLVTAPAPAGKCTFGDRTARKTIVVVGDSHANMWSPAFNQFAKANHFRFILYAKAACSPGIYPTYIDPETNRIYTQCNTWRKEVIAKVEKLKPNVVLLASELRTQDVNPTGMIQTIDDYRQFGIKVIYLEDTPNPEKKGLIPDCLAKNPSNVQQCSMFRSNPTTRLSAFVQRNIESSAAKRAGAKLIDPTSWFCTATICPVVINNMIVYADNSHITATYAKWLSPVMGAALKRATEGIHARHRHAHGKRKHHKTRVTHHHRKVHSTHKHRPGHAKRG